MYLLQICVGLSLSEFFLNHSWTQQGSMGLLKKPVPAPLCSLASCPFTLVWSLCLPGPPQFLYLPSSYLRITALSFPGISLLGSPYNSAWPGKAVNPLMRHIPSPPLDIDSVYIAAKANIYVTVASCILPQLVFKYSHHLGRNPSP